MIAHTHGIVKGKKSGVENSTPKYNAKNRKDSIILPHYSYCVKCENITCSTKSYCTIDNLELCTIVKVYKYRIEHRSGSIYYNTSHTIGRYKIYSICFCSIYSTFYTFKKYIIEFKIERCIFYSTITKSYSISSIYIYITLNLPIAKAMKILLKFL